MFVGVFDGHLGPGASEYASWSVPYCFVRSHLADVLPALRHAFLATDRALSELATKYRLNCGTTAACCVVTDRHVFAANVGDSEAFLARRGGVVQLSYLHVATDASEQERIVNQGGKIFNYQGKRVEGVMQVTRSLGDQHFKRFIIPEPYTAEAALDGTEEFLLLATDGLFHVFAPADTIALVRALLRGEPAPILETHGIPAPAAKEAIPDTLVALALRLGSSDNVSVVIVFF